MLIPLEAEIKTNALSGETSPYLLQHAHNPVDWYPCGDEALALAKKENKPIFLSTLYPCVGKSCFAPVKGKDILEYHGSMMSTKE